MQAFFRVLTLAASDLLCVYGAWGFSVLAYHAVGLGNYDPADYLRLWPIGLVFVAINAAIRLYQGRWWCPSIPVSPVEELRRLVISSFVTHIGLLGFLGLAYQTTDNYSRLVTVFSGVLVAVSSQLIRNVARALLAKLKIGQISVLLAGSGEVAARVNAVVAGNAYLGLRIVETSDSCETLVQRGRAHGIRIVLACQDLRRFRVQLTDLSRWFTHVVYLPTADVFPVFGSRPVALGNCGGLEMVNQARMRFIRLEKWLLDRTLAVFVLVLLFPLFLIIPVLIKLTSRGPVFYRQDRLGLHGRQIRIWKFRSMYADADERLRTILAKDPKTATEWQATFKLQNDPRVTSFGWFLRKTSLDELPQLFNVFIGDMAIVGPRPIVRAEIVHYGSAYEVFSSALPGITGLWQVSGRSDTDYPSRVALDVQYILNWSPWLDIWILMRTAFAVLLMRGAR